MWLRAKVRLGCRNWIACQFVACSHAMHRPFARLIRQLPPTFSTEEPQVQTRPAPLVRLQKHIYHKHAHNSLLSPLLRKLPSSPYTPFSKSNIKSCLTFLHSLPPLALRTPARQCSRRARPLQQQRIGNDIVHSSKAYTWTRE
jgi:hypothetical protein